MCRSKRDKEKTEGKGQGRLRRERTMERGERDCEEREKGRIGSLCKTFVIGQASH